MNVSAVLLPRAALSVCLLASFTISAAALGEQISSRAVAHAAPGRGAPLGLETFDAAWNIIYTTHFDTNFNGVNWTAVRDQYRPRAAAASSTEELRAILSEMLARLGQSHMSIIPQFAADAFQARASGEPKLESGAPPSASPRSVGVDPRKNTSGMSGQRRAARQDGDLGFDVRLIGREMVVSRVDPKGPAERAGVRSGWIVRSIGKERLQSLLKQLPKGINTRQAQFMAWGIARAQLLGAPGSKVQLEFLDGANRPVRLTLERREPVGESVKFGLLPTLYARFEEERFVTGQGATIGVIRFNMWMAPIAGLFDQTLDEFRNADGIVIDLRGNIGGIGGMVMGLSGHFLKERVSLGTMKMRGNELKFFTNPRWVNGAGLRVEPFSGPVAILVDGISLSAAEIFAGGLQDIGRARVFGETSAGQALPALWDRLPNGDVLYHAFADYITASGIRLEGRGVIPDVPVPLRREDLLAGRDAPLLAAVRWIEEQRRQKAISMISPEAF